MAHFELDKINKTAELYFSDESNLTYRNKLIELVLGPVEEDSLKKSNNILTSKDNCAKSDSEEKIRFLNIETTFDVFCTVLLKAMGVYDSGSTAGKYDPTRGAAFSTFLVYKINKENTTALSKSYEEERILYGRGNPSENKKSGDDKPKKSSLDPDRVFKGAVEYAEDEHGNDTATSELIPVSEDEYFDPDNSAIIQLSHFFCELIKTKRKGIVDLRTVYSYYLVNFSRNYDSTFARLNDYSDELFEPSEEGNYAITGKSFIRWSTTYPHNVHEDFLGLSKSDFSDYVISNSYIKKERELEIKAVDDYCGSSNAGVTISKLKKEMQDIFK